MKKLATLATSTAMTLALAVPAFAQNIGVSQPTEVKIVDIGKLISTGVSVIMILAGILVFVFLVWGGMEWILSGGDKTKVESAQKRITNALVGLAIIASSWALIKIISYFFGVQSGIGGALTIPKPY